MPHKHRQAAGNDALFELAPHVQAEPLAVAKSSLGKRDRDKSIKSKSSRKRARKDDTPMAFIRLMQFNAARPDLKLETKSIEKIQSSGAAHPIKRRKNSAAPEVLPVKALMIAPGERLSEFGARVDASMAFGGGANGDKKLRFAGSKDGQLTRHAKKLRKMQSEWRKEEARRKALREAGDDDSEEQDEITSSFAQKKGKRSSRRDSEDDPWAVLALGKADKPAGLHDVAQAPPRLDGVKQMKDGAIVVVANVPRAAGSLSKREGLGEERSELIQRYRQIMKNSQRAEI